MIQDIVRSSIIDPDTRKETIRSILEDEEPTSGENFILAVTFASVFATSDEERVSVAAIVKRGMRDHDPGYFFVQGITSPREKAEKSLLALSLFRRRCLAGRLPHAKSIYERTGRNGFESCREYGIAINFSNWCAYLEDMIAPSMNRLARSTVECASFTRVKRYS